MLGGMVSDLAEAVSYSIESLIAAGKDWIPEEAKRPPVPSADASEPGGMEATAAFTISPPVGDTATITTAASTTSTSVATTD